MKFQTEKERAVRSALYRIAASSPMANHTVYSRDDGKRVAQIMSVQWRTGEHALVWSIYERAVFDESGLVMRFLGKKVAPIPNQTARMGMVSLPSGKRVNILELLGIEPEWARAQLDAALNYMQKQAA